MRINLEALRLDLTQALVLSENLNFNQQCVEDTHLLVKVSQEDCKEKTMLCMLQYVFPYFGYMFD